MQVSSKAGKIAGTGQVVKAKKAEDQDKKETGNKNKESIPAEDRAAMQGSMPEEPELSDAQKPEFNENIVVDARVDQEKEGGVSKAKSTGMAGLSDSSHAVFKISEDYLKDKYELTGFTVMYTLPGTKDIHSEEVRVYFDSLDQAKDAIKDGKYIHKEKNADTPVEMEITRGAPTISVNEVMKAEFIDGQWRRT